MIFPLVRKSCFLYYLLYCEYCLRTKQGRQFSLRITTLVVLLEKPVCVGMPFMINKKAASFLAAFSYFKL